MKILLNCKFGKILVPKFCIYQNFLRQSDYSILKSAVSQERMDELA